MVIEADSQFGEEELPPYPAENSSYLPEWGVASNAARYSRTSSTCVGVTPPSTPEDQCVIVQPYRTFLSVFRPPDTVRTGSRGDKRGIDNRL